MATLLPTSQSTSVEAYEDMFKEITRKLYGEESAHGLYPHNTQVAQLAPGTPLIPEADQQRSFTTLVSDRSLAQLEYENAIDNTFKTEDHLSTAFGLAALMQNGFPPPGAILNPVNFGTNGNKQNSNTVNNLLLGSNDNDNKLKTAFAGIATSNTDDRWASTEDLLASWNPSKISNYTTNQKNNIFKSVKPKQEPICTVTDTSLIQNITNSLMNSSTNVQQNLTKSLTAVNVPNLTPTVTKRYSCSSCPYSTDRRDLFTRHENIHKEEKPFHCYACLKQFNRADHVKKHFLRMHRDMTYDINKTRKTPAKNNFYNNQTTTQNQNNQNLMQQQLTEQLLQQQQQQQQQQNQIPLSIQTSNATTLNIPSSFTSVAQNIQLNAINNLQSTIAQQSLQQNVVNTLNGLAVVQQQQQQQHQSQNQTQLTQQQPQQQNLLPNNVVIKQEKVEKSPPKKKSEKRFMCCYCSWSGADNWGLKRHLNTHTKPFVCLLCDYKAARSERLATHVFKVHNKKACNKCTFFADDQNQLIAHQLEAHPSDSRTANQRQNSNQTITTININNNPSQNITTTVNTNNSSVNVNNSSNNGVLNGGSNNNHANLNATTNVLRTLQNTFVPNVSALNSTQNNVSTGNVFGSINSSVLSNSTIYTSNSVNNTTNILNNLNQHLSTNNSSNNNNNTNSLNTNSNANNWRLNANNIISVTLATTGNNTNTTNTNSTSVSTTHATRQKHGAERLFAYFEADGSDPEDYNRQLAMQALNHNKASVAQDFHKAGGQFGNFYAKLHQQQLQQQDQFSNDDDEENQQGIDKISYYNNNNNLKQLSNNNDKEKATSCSPPAVPLSNNQSKRRRTTSLNATNNDKENFSNSLKSNVFDKLYQKSIANFMQQLVPSDNSGNSDPESNTRLMEFLENNPDLTISRVKSNKPAVTVDLLTSPRHNRKQSQPRKIDKVEKSDFSKEALQDKYLNQLVSDTGLKCRDCAKDKSCTLDLTYRTKGALLFHRLWRHSERKVRCKRCRKRFDRKYRLKLHWMKTHKHEEVKRRRGRPRKNPVKNPKTTKGGKTGKKRRRRRRFF